MPIEFNDRLKGTFLISNVNDNARRIIIRSNNPARLVRYGTVMITPPIPNPVIMAVA